jgi:uncharacterized protein YbcI
MLNNGTRVSSVQITGRQNNATLNANVRDRLGQEFLILWQQAHGAPQGVVNVTVVQNGLLFLIENAFSQAELALARQSTDNLLQQYIDSLTRQMMPALTTHVEQVMGQQIRATSITPNIEQNWIMVFMKFDEPVTSESEL